MGHIRALCGPHQGFMWGNIRPLCRVYQRCMFRRMRDKFGSVSTLSVGDRGFGAHKDH